MLVIGNGESRKHLDISKLNQPKIGCNAIFRDYFTEHLVCVDRRMVQEAILAEINTKNTFIYTRADWCDQFRTLHIRKVPDLFYKGTERWDEPFNWGSGPYAVLLGAMLTKTAEVKLIGFDLYSSTKLVNNIYKSTLNYDNADKHAVDPRYWIHQIMKVFEYYNNINFILYNTTNWQLPVAWNMPNVKVDSISNIYYNT